MHPSLYPGSSVSRDHMGGPGTCPMGGSVQAGAEDKSDLTGKEI